MSSVHQTNKISAAQLGVIIYGLIDRCFRDGHKKVTGQLRANSGKLSKNHQDELLAAFIYAGMLAIEQRYDESVGMPIMEAFIHTSCDANARRRGFTELLRLRCEAYRTTFMNASSSGGPAWEVSKAVYRNITGKEVGHDIFGVMMLSSAVFNLASVIRDNIFTQYTV